MGIKKKTIKPASKQAARKHPAISVSRVPRQGQTTCVCGHSVEEHGHDPEYPGSTACATCEPGDCIAYEAEQG